MFDCVLEAERRFLCSPSLPLDFLKDLQWFFVLVPLSVTVQSISTWHRGGVNLSEKNDGMITQLPIQLCFQDRKSVV